jgi:DNA-binding Xre family transcriptional regulator
MKEIQENKFSSIFDKWSNDPDFQKDYEKEFKEFALSELMLAIMDDDQKSVRKLAELAGVSASSIQDLRSGKSKDVKLRNFVNIVESCGYGIELVKGNKRIPIQSNNIDFSNAL